MTRFSHCCRSSTGCVIGHGGLHSSMNEAVLLEVPRLNVKFRFAAPRTESHEANTKVRHERCCVEYPFQFLAWQFVELLHVLRALLRPTADYLTKELHNKPSSTKLACRIRPGVDTGVQGQPLTLSGQSHQASTQMIEQRNSRASSCCGNDRINT